MNEASQPSQQNTIIEEIKNRVLEVDALRHGTQHPEDIELPLDYIEALDEVTSIDREEIEDIARDVIAKHKNITRVLPPKRQKNKQRDVNQWLINISLLLIISVIVKVVFLDDGSPKDPSEKTFATTIASTDFSALQQEATNTFSSIVDSALALIPNAEDLPDLPFSIEDFDTAAIEASASQTLSSIIQSAKDLLPQEDIQTVSNNEVVQAEDEIIIAEQNLAEAAPVSETRVTQTTNTDIAAETKEAETKENLIANNDIASTSDTESDSKPTSIPSSKATLAKAQAVIAEAPIETEQTLALAAPQVTNKVIENAMTKGTTVEEELEKAALSNAGSDITTANTIANTGIDVVTPKAVIEDATIAALPDEIASITATNKPVIEHPIEQKSLIKNPVTKSSTAHVNNTQVDAIAVIKDVSDKADKAIALASTVNSDAIAEVVSTEQKVATQTVEVADVIEVTAQQPSNTEKSNPELTAKTAVVDATDIAQNDTNISAANVEAENKDTLATEAIATVPVIISDTKLMKVLDEAFIQLSNIKALPLPDLAIKAKDIKAETASANTEITDAESIDIADTDIATTEIINIAVANTSGADKQVTTVPEKDVTPSTTANNTLPVEPQLITQETTALIEQPKDIQAIETKVTDTKATVPQVTSIAPVELIADAKPPKPTAKVTAEKKQTVAEAQTNLALTQVNSNQAVSTLSAKPISTEPEITQLTLAARTLAKLNIEPEPNIGAELNIESADINTPTETAPNTPSNSASQVLRATLNADDAIDEVTQKLIAAQQAPSNIKAITQQVVSQIAQPKPNNTEAAALTVQATPVVPEQTVSQQTQPKQAASKADEVVRQTVTPAIATPAIAAPAINAPATAQVVASKQNSQTNYNGLNLKLQLNSIVDLTQLAKMSVSQFYNQKSRLPKPSDNIDLPINDLKAHPLINDIYLSEQSDVIVKLAKYYGDDSQLTFTPSITNDVGLINWKCHANIDPSLLVGPGESPCSLTQSAAAPASTTKL